MNNPLSDQPVTEYRPTIPASQHSHSCSCESSSGSSADSGNSYIINQEESAQVANYFITGVGTAGLFKAGGQTGPYTNVYPGGILATDGNPDFSQASAVSLSPYSIGIFGGGNLYFSISPSDDTTIVNASVPIIFASPVRSYVAPIDDLDLVRLIDLEMAIGPLPDGVKSGLGLSMSGNQLTVAPGVWQIGGVNYTKGNNTVFTLQPQDPALYRYDVVYAKPDNTVGLVTGTFSATPVEPGIPAGTIKVGNVLISPTAYTPTQPDLSGFVTLNTTQTITGSKQLNGRVFSNYSPTQPTDLVRLYDLNPYAVDSSVVHKAGNESVTGTKTFSGLQIMPDGSGNSGINFLNNDGSYSILYYGQGSGSNHGYLNFQGDSLQAKIMVSPIFAVDNGSSRFYTLNTSGLLRNADSKYALFEGDALTPAGAAATYVAKGDAISNQDLTSSPQVASYYITGNGYHKNPSGQSYSTYQNALYNTITRVGSIGNPEGLLSWNMDYDRTNAVGKHLPDDNTYNSWWLSLGASGATMQYALSGQTQTGFLKANVTNGGSGYTNGTYNVTVGSVINLTGTGSGANATVYVVGGVVTNVIPGVGGAGYAIGDTFTIAASLIGGTGSGFVATITAIGNDIDGSKLYGWKVTNAGKFLVGTTGNDVEGDSQAQFKRPANLSSIGGWTDLVLSGGKNYADAAAIFLNPGNAGDINIATGGGKIRIGGAVATTFARTTFGGEGVIQGSVIRGLQYLPNLTATANNQTLIANDFAATFVNGAFTGVTNYEARFGSNIQVNGGILNLGNGTSNIITYAGAGLGAPTFTTRSGGTKAVWFPAITGSTADYATLVESGALSNSVPATSNSFKWYGGTTLAATLTGTGTFTPIAIGSTTTATTQAAGTNNTTLATTAFVTTAIANSVIPVVEILTTSQAAVVNTKYIANNSGLVTITLPTNAAQGTQILIRGKGAGGWKLAQNTGQVIHGATDSTVGTGGSIASQARYDTVALECITANTEWSIIANRGTLTIV